MTLASTVAEVFADGGALARTIEGYEPRAGQRLMAMRVADAVDAGGILLAEAGTGTGKTLAYLVPAVLSRVRVVVSTGTKNLQEQIFFKDVPALRAALGIDVSATLMKGRSNYLCLHRLSLYREGVEAGTSRIGRLVESADQVLLPIIEAWAADTATGDRAELRDLPEDLPLWTELAADAERCLGTECPRFADCFVTRMRQRAAEADVVIVNHHLLCADAALRHGEMGEVIPGAPTLVVDEAHQLEDVATQYFGVSLSSHAVEDLARDGARLADSLGALQGSEALAADVGRAAERVLVRGRAFFGALHLQGSQGTRFGEARLRYTAESLGEHADEALALGGALEGLEAALSLADGVGGSGGRDMPDDLAALARRAGELRSSLRFLIRAEDPQFVYSVEIRGRGAFLRAAPIDVSRIVRDALFERPRTTILTSATLAIDASFDYIRGRLGVADASEVQVPSEFDYRQQAILYLPRHMPLPTAAEFGEAVAREVLQILTRSRGRAFVLFTSYAVLRTVQRVVQASLPYPLLVQGTAPRSILIEQFRTTPNAVLLATSSFWQGVDVVGDALSCVIIDKLPFASPGDPITAARIEAIRARGGDAFAEYQVPLAILSLQQGLGRLIRHRTDRGVLAILDPRLRTRGYGRRFLASLPPAPLTTDLGEIERFFM